MLNWVEFRSMVRTGGKMAEKQLPDHDLRLLYKQMGGTLTAGITVHELTDFVWRGTWQPRALRSDDQATLVKPAVMALCQRKDDLPRLWRKFHPNQNAEQKGIINTVEVTNVLNELGCTVPRNTVVYMMRRLGAEFGSGRELLSMPFAEFVTMLPQLCEQLGLVEQPLGAELKGQTPEPEPDTGLDMHMQKGPVRVYQLTSDNMVNRVPPTTPGSPRFPAATTSQQQQQPRGRGGRGGQTRRENTEELSRAGRSHSRARGKDQVAETQGQQGKVVDDGGRMWLAAKGRSVEREIVNGFLVLGMPVSTLTCTLV
jgi:hypothetical protein